MIENHIQDQAAETSGATPTLTPLQESLGFLLKKASKLIDSRIRKRLLTLGMTHAEWVTLRILVEEDGLSMRDIAKQSNTVPSHITLAVDHLEAKKFAERHPDKMDRRVMKIHLTELGRSYFYNELLSKVADAIVLELSDQEAEELRSILKSILKT